MPLHQSRKWCVCEVSDADSLAEKITEHTWTACTGFRLGRYLFLNDSISENGAQEYAILTDGPKLRQIESITFSWCDLGRARQHIAAILRGEYDNEAYGEVARAQIQTPAQHVVCRACA